MGINLWPQPPSLQNEEQKGAPLSQMSRFADILLAADGSQQGWEGNGKKQHRKRKLTH